MTNNHLTRSDCTVIEYTVRFRWMQMQMGTVLFIPLDWQECVRPKHSPDLFFWCLFPIHIIYQLDH